jgi:flavin-binding protein dodecin
MAVRKVIELLADSEKSWEDAANNAVKEAAKTLKGINSVYIHDLSATVDKGKISRYRVNARVTFEIKGK